ncbi:MAG: hypothetical protein ACO35E_12245 [Ilumatobacteraceae bacterium]|jgi:hypothetical protein
MSDDTPDVRAPDEVVDSLPEDLDPTAFAGAYRFPDNSRRRIPATVYLVAGAFTLSGVWWATGSARFNSGLALAAACLVGFAAYGLATGRRMHIDERNALVAAQQELGFPIGHASAQQVWRGVASRPTWRVLAYSAEEPPRRRALILVDAIDGRVVEHLVEENPEGET